MCIAIYKPEGILVPRSHLEESFEYNPDGAGFMYAENGELHIEKGFMTFEKFMEAWEPHQEKPAAIHFRIKTHGEIHPENTHPFQVGKNLGVIHNGIISNVDTASDPNKSDTYHFNEQFLSQIYRRDSRFIFKKHYADLVKSYIGASKLVFLNNKGHHTIINEKMGTWDEGVWYSNNSYKPVSYNPRRRKKDTQTCALPPANPDRSQFSVGQRVSVSYSNWTNGKREEAFYIGTIVHFGNGLTVGVKVDGKEEVRIAYLGYCMPIVEKEVEDSPFNSAEFGVGDWVVRNDPSFGDTDEIGEVQGTFGEAVIVKWLNEAGLPAGPEFVINRHRLEHWYSSPANTFGAY